MGTISPKAIPPMTISPETCNYEWTFLLITISPKRQLIDWAISIYYKFRDTLTPY